MLFIHGEVGHARPSAFDTSKHLGLGVDPRYTHACFVWHRPSPGDALPGMLTHEMLGHLVSWSKCINAN